MAKKVRRGRNRPNARRQQFDQAVRAGANARQAARDAGYSTHTANTKSYEMARTTLAECFPKANITHERIGLKLSQLLDAKVAKWNPKKNRWDEFADGHLQLEAVREINRVDDAYPAPKEKVEDSRPITIVLPSSLSAMKPVEAKS